MLPSSPHVESVYSGDGGVINAARKGHALHRHVHGGSRRLAARGRRGGRARPALRGRAGVGRTPRAIDGTLAIMVGASGADFQAALPALQAMGANVIHVGPVGSGEVAKLCNNLIAG